MLRRDPVLIEFERDQTCKAPMYCNKYAMDDMDERPQKRPPPNMRSQSMPRQSRYGDRLMPPQAMRQNSRGSTGDYDENAEDMPLRKGRKPSRPGKFCCCIPLFSYTHTHSLSTSKLFQIHLFSQKKTQSTTKCPPSF
jgi:hypothetical protein